MIHISQMFPTRLVLVYCRFDALVAFTQTVHEL